MASKETGIGKAIAQTWGARCDQLFFIINEEVSAPDTVYNATMIKLSIDHQQSARDRNLWFKVWRMWYHVGMHHLNDAEFFFKIDDDSFFSAVNFRGFGQYYNPDGEWYFGHTLMHLWDANNIVFNAGACYGISRGALRKIYPIFGTQAFLNDSQRKMMRGYCVDGYDDREDLAMGLCLRSLGINPTNTLDNEYRERFLIWTPEDHHAKVNRTDTWFWKHKHPKVGILDNCCNDNPISFHNYKGKAYEKFYERDLKYNKPEGFEEKKFEVPSNGSFLFDIDSAPDHDEYFNSKNIPNGQRIYKGPGKERVCYQCDDFDIK